jgi:hypothetical protein
MEEGKVALETMEVNGLSGELATQRMLDCCHSRKWAFGMVNKRPFSSLEALFEASDSVFETLEEADWL